MSPFIWTYLHFKDHKNIVTLTCDHATVAPGLQIVFNNLHSPGDVQVMSTKGQVKLPGMGIDHLYCEIVKTLFGVPGLNSTFENKSW